MTSLTDEECECGRTTVRMDNVTGRTDDLLIVRGVNVYPSQIEAVMVDMDEVAPHYRIDLRRDGELDQLEITAERHESHDGAAADLADRIATRLKETLDVSPDSVQVVDPGGIDRTEVGKYSGCTTIGSDGFEVGIPGVRQRNHLTGTVTLRGVTPVDDSRRPAETTGVPKFTTLPAYCPVCPTYSWSVAVQLV